MLNEVQKEKMANFNLMVENKDEVIALEFLKMSNWDEVKAVKLYLENIQALNNPFQNHNHNINIPSNININNNNRNQTFKECQFPMIQDMRSGFGIKRNNSEYCNYFNGTIIGLVKDSDRFMKLLKTKKGVIKLYNNQISDVIKQQLNLISNYSYDKIKNTLFYPILDILLLGFNRPKKQIKQLGKEIENI